MRIDGIEVRGITCDSRKVRSGYIFVAIQGEEEDGNRYIEDAIKKGAAIIYTEKDIHRTDVVIKKVDNARITLANLCNAFYDYPSEKLKVVGVTGTNGKTTTTHMIYHILREQGIEAGLIGTLQIKINDQEYGTQLTTPPAEEIYYYLWRMVEEGVKVVVMEVSSHGLKAARVHGIRFSMAIHTNIERDHLNFHKTLEDYIGSKKILFDYLPSGGNALINFDDEHGLKLLEGNRRAVVVTYGLHSKSSATASSIDTDFATTFTYCLQRGLTTLSGVEIEPFEHPFLLNVLGKHNIYNALATITCLLLLDVPLKCIVESLKTFRSVPRRVEMIHKKEFTVIDDYCHNPASYEALFESIQNLKYKNLHIVNAIRGNRGVGVNKENVEVIKHWVQILKPKTLVITSSSDQVGALDRVHTQEREAFLVSFDEEGIPFQYVSQLRNAIKETLAHVEQGDMLLLLGAQGMDQGKEIFLEHMEKNHMNQMYLAQEIREEQYRN